MASFVVGNLLVFAAAFAWNAHADPTLLYGPTGNLVRVALVLLAIPMTVTAGAAVMIHRLRPRRLFDAARNRLIASSVGGAMTGIGTMILTALAVILLDKSAAPNDLFDSGAIAAAAFVSACTFLLVLCRRRRPGLCLRCAYDIRGSLNAGRCPECGLAF